MKKLSTPLIGACLLLFLAFRFNTSDSEFGLDNVDLKEAYLDSVFQQRNSFPERLSETEAFTDLVSLAPSEGIIPYGVNSPLWSDGAEKHRWISIPKNSEKVKFSSDSSWTFPAGTVFIKHFEMAINEDSINRLETRFVIVYENSSITGITYKWNDEGTEAYLIEQDERLSKSVILETEGGSTLLWKFPSRGECLECHNRNAGNVLGVKTSQLNNSYLYPSSKISSNQVLTWNHLGLFSEDISNIDSLPRLRSLSDTSASVEYRIRSYIDANCSYCHRPEGVRAAFDARISTPLCNQSIVDEDAIGFYSDNGSKVVATGDYQSSEMWKRNNSDGEVRMPPLGTSVIDKEYISLLENWISGLGYDSQLSLPVCDTVFISPSGKYNWMSNGTYYDTLMDIHGCDSILKLDLKFSKISLDSQVVELTSGDSMLWRGDFIHKAGVYFDTLTTIGGCDSIIIAEVEITEPILSIKRTINDIQFRIFPNPTCNTLNVISQSNIPAYTNISVFDVSGLEIESFLTEKSSAKLMLDVDHLEQGTYLIILEYRGKVDYLKFIKQ